MSIRLATLDDIPGVSSLVARYWNFEAIAGFGYARIEALLRTLLLEPERGLVRVQLQLATGNSRARHFYAQHGFLARAGYELLDKPVTPPAAPPIAHNQR